MTIIEKQIDEKVMKRHLDISEWMKLKNDEYFDMIKKVNCHLGEAS